MDNLANLLYKGRYKNEKSSGENMKEEFPKGNLKYYINLEK